MKNRLSWCAGAKNGITLIAPNDDLAAAYLRKSEEAMEAMHSVASRDWKLSAGYYSLYFSLYAVLMKIGIKSENHVCTIEIMQHLIMDFFTRDECELLEEARQARVKTQYYTTSDVSSAFEDTLVRQVPRLLVKCRGIVDHLDAKKIRRIRDRYAELVKRVE
jgi:uncharacterized protein (UPF0332 family)